MFLIHPLCSHLEKKNPLFLFLFAGAAGTDREQGATFAGLTEQCITVAGGGLPARAHGEKGRSAVW